MDLHRTGKKSLSDLAELFGVGRSTVYRALERAGDAVTPVHLATAPWAT